MTFVSSTGAFDGAGFNRILSDWRLWNNDPNIDWLSDAGRMASRAWDLIRNDPVIAALASAKISGTHGPTGLRYRSLHPSGDSELRKQIENYVAQNSKSTYLDANGMMTRNEFEEALDLLSTVSGEGWAVRQFIPGRPGAKLSTCWRLIRPERIRNRSGIPDSESLYQGVELDKNGAPQAIWVAPPQRYGYVDSPKDFTRVPWYAEDGSRNVIQRVGLRQPGAFRGISMLAPNLLTARQTKGLVEAYVIAKRIQACHVTIIQCDDPIAAAKADRNGAVFGPNTTYEPGKVYYVGRDSAVNFPTWTFSGQDMREFLDTIYRNQFAAWGMPIDVVLAQLGETNMAASRSAWLQYYRQCERWQDDHIQQVTSILDESIIREGMARGDLPTGPIEDMTAGRYVRPPRAMPDPLKEAQAVQLWTQLGRDLTGLWAESGVDFRESIVQRAEDNQTLKDAGVEMAPMVTGAQTEEPEGDEATDEDSEAPAEKDKAPTALTVNLPEASAPPVLVNVDVPQPKRPIRWEITHDPETKRPNGMRPIFKES